MAQRKQEKQADLSEELKKALAALKENGFSPEGGKIEFMAGFTSRADIKIAFTKSSATKSAAHETTDQGKLI